MTPEHLTRASESPESDATDADGETTDGAGHRPDPLTPRRQEELDVALAHKLAQETPLVDLARDVPEAERAMWISDAEARFGEQLGGH